MAATVQFDPALGELLLTSPAGPPLGGPAWEVPIVARLHDPSTRVPGLRVVARFGAVVTARAARDQVVAIRGHANVASLRASRALCPDLAVSVPEVRAPSPRRPGAPGVTGRGVVVAVLDWGMDFAHANFRDERGRTRLRCIWDQRGGGGPLSPLPFGYGRELARARIDEALQAPDPYGALGYDPADADPYGLGSHGTHVADIAAGNGYAPGSAPGVAPGADLIFVHLAGNDTAPEDTLGDSVRLLEAVRYAADRAGEAPLVINVSLGSQGGPHDGTTLVEQALDALVAEQPGRAVAMSAGNYREADAHASGRVARGERADLVWLVEERADGVSELEIWYSGADRLDLELVTPSGATAARVALGERAAVHASGSEVGFVHHRRCDPNNGDNVADIFLRPGAPAGSWVVRLSGREVVDGTFHAWIERDDPRTQSRFAPGLSTGEGTTGTLCNGHRTLAVGAYDAREPPFPLLGLSSGGLTRDGRQKPDLTAPGAAVVAARSRGGLTAKSGTSMAAPHVTGTIALMFEAVGRRGLAWRETRDILLSTARPIDTVDPAEALRCGAGRLDAGAAVEVARRLAAPPAEESNLSRRTRTMTRNTRTDANPTDHVYGWLTGSRGGTAARSAPDPYALAEAIESLRGLLEEARGLPPGAASSLAEAPTVEEMAEALADHHKLSDLFRDKLRLYAADLGTDDRLLLAVMYAESTFDPAAKNEKSSASGLIQIVEENAKELGTTTEALRAMTAEAQLDYVWLYFKLVLKQHKAEGKLKTLSDVYMAVFTPAYIGQPGEWVLYTAGSDGYKKNAPLDLDKDEIMTKEEATSWVIKRVTVGYSRISKTTKPKGKGVSKSTRKELKKDDKGDAVEELQNALVELGHLTKPDTKDGKNFYGDRTAWAVTLFQDDNHLTNRGHVDLETWEAIDLIRAGVKRWNTSKDKSETERGVVKCLQDRLIKLGSDYLTEELKATNPGFFGPNTEKGLKKFQRDRGFEVDGTLDAEMYKALLTETRTESAPESGPSSSESWSDRRVGRRYDPAEAIDALIGLGQLWAAATRAR